MLPLNARALFMRLSRINLLHFCMHSLQRLFEFHFLFFFRNVGKALLHSSVVGFLSLFQIQQRRKDINELKKKREYDFYCVLDRDIFVGMLK